MDELFVGIVDASGTALGVLNLSGVERRKGRYGGLEYQDSELVQLQEFGKLIGAFAESRKRRQLL